MTSAQSLHAGSRTADVSFDGASGQPTYRVKTFQDGHVSEHVIDAKTGDLAANEVVSSLSAEQTSEPRRVFRSSALRALVVDVEAEGWLSRGDPGRR